MTSIRTLIVDDEAPARNWLHDLCAKHADIIIVGQCGSASQAIQRLCAGGIDLLLLDIQLGPITGFEVLHEVPPMRAPLVIFVTAFDQHAVQAFEENAIDYLLKPVTADRFGKAIERVRSQMSRGLVADLYGNLRAALVPLQRALQASRGVTMPPRIVGERDGAYYVVDVRAIELIEVDGNYVAIRTVGDAVPYLKRSTLQDISALLDAKHFLRIRRSCMVNLAHVARIERESDDLVVVLNSERRIVVGRSYRHAVAEFVRTSRTGPSTTTAAMTSS